MNKIFLKLVFIKSLVVLRTDTKKKAETEGNTAVRLSSHLERRE